MYKIRTCIECGHKLHIRQKGRLQQIKNRCKHFSDELISMEKLDALTVPIEDFREIIGIKTVPRLCAIHKCELRFLRYLMGSGQLYYCSRCKILHDLIPLKHIRWWMKKTWNKNWKAGDVKMSVGQNRG